MCLKVDCTEGTANSVDPYQILIGLYCLLRLVFLRKHTLLLYIYVVNNSSFISSNMKILRHFHYSKFLMS